MYHIFLHSQYLFAIFVVDSERTNLGPRSHILSDQLLHNEGVSADAFAPLPKVLVQPQPCRGRKDFAQIGGNPGKNSLREGKIKNEHIAVSAASVRRTETLTASGLSRASTPEGGSTRKN